MIKLYSRAEAKQLFSEALFNVTSKVSLVSKHSVISGFINACARLLGLVNKELSVVEMYLDINAAYGEYLDRLAQDQFGVSARFGASGSSTYILLKGDVGTTYISGTHNFSGDHGIEFQLDSDVTIGDLGYTYAKISSTTVGSKTNVDPLSINKITVALVGHIACINEYRAEYGSEAESDEVFRARIKDSINSTAKSTLAQLVQVFQKTNNNVLDVYNYGYNSNGQIILAILTQNGQDLSNGELAILTSQASEYLAISEISMYGGNFLGVQLKNIEYQPIDITFKADFFDYVDLEDWRKNCQIKISKFLDYRIWPKDKSYLDRGDLLAICKSVDGVKYIPDAYFFPKIDIAIEYGKVLRVRSFLIYSLNNLLLSEGSEIMNPIYYPNTQEVNYQLTNLMTV